MTDAALPPRPPLAARSPVAWAVFAGVAVAVLASDLLLKWWSFATVAGVPITVSQHAGAGAALPAHEPIVVVPHVLNLQLVLNRGAVFGVLPGARWFFIAVTLIAVVVVVSLFWRSGRRAWPIHLALALILGGAIGNLYDRIVFTAVRDMLHMLPGVHLPFGLGWGGGETEVWPWRFNIADASLMVGVGLMLLITLRSELRRSKHETAPG